MRTTLTAPPTPSRRAGLGRRVTEIVDFDDLDAGPTATLVNGPVVVPLAVVPFALIVVDERGHALMSNRQWSQLSGLGAKESLGSGWRSAFGDGDPEEVEHVLHGPAPVGSTRVRGRPVRWARAAESAAGQNLVGIGVFALDQPDAPPTARPGQARPASPPAAPGGDTVIAELADLVTQAAALLDALGASSLLA